MLPIIRPYWAVLIEQFWLEVRWWLCILVYNKQHSAKSPCKCSGPSPTSCFNQDLWVWLKDRGRRFVSELRADVQSVADVSVHSFHTFTAWDNKKDLLPSSTNLRQMDTRKDFCHGEQVFPDSNSQNWAFFYKGVWGLSGELYCICKIKHVHL